MDAIVIDLNAAQCEVIIYTFKEGLLSAIAHDLAIRATKLDATIHDAKSSIHVQIQTNSLRVMHAMRGGVPSPSTLSDKDKAEIEATMHSTVLDAKRWPTISFSSSRVAPTPSGFVIEGTLSLHGKDKAIHVVLDRSGGQLVGNVTLHQPDFGITPYRAALGALRVQPAVRIALNIAWPQT